MSGVGRSSHRLHRSFASKAWQKRAIPVHGALHLGLLDRACGVDALRTDNAALANEGAVPRSVVQPDALVPLFLSLVARIVIIALRQRKYRGSEETTVILIYRAGGIAEHTIDAQAVLLEVCQFLGSLSVFTFFDWLWMGADNPRLYFRQLFQKIVERCYEIAFDGKVGQRFDLDRPRSI